MGMLGQPRAPGGQSSIDAPADLDERSARDAIRTMIGESHPIQLRSMDPWQARMLGGNRYRHGRCFLAGDAPTKTRRGAGSGRNNRQSGGDAVDLGWKIAAALHGWAGRACSTRTSTNGVRSRCGRSPRQSTHDAGPHR